jgi:uncharacterized protein (TIRG00374 family)
MNQSKFKKVSANAVKLSIVLLLLYFLSQKGLLSLSELQRTLEFPSLLALALLSSTLGMILGIYRWRLLLRGQDIELGWRRTVQLTLIGNFFNLALPGAVSGDLVKAFYIAREFPGKRGLAFGSILFDRIVGVSGLVLVSSLAMLIGYRSLHENHVFQAIQWFVFASGSGVLLFFLYLFFMPENYDPVRNSLEALQRRFGGAASLARIYEGVRNYHHHRWMVLESLLVSCVIHVFAASNCVLFTLALEGAGSDLQWIALYALAPLGLLATAVPLAPAGVGTGHAAFSWLYLLLGYKAGANVFSLFVVFQILWGIIGGLVYLRFKSEIPKTVFTAHHA